jgi:hypothetical protein
VTETERTDGAILHLWLRLLGWQIEIGRDGDQLVGIGRHLLADGSAVRIGGCASSEGELALQLFEQAMGRLSCSRLSADHRFAAA